MKDLIVLLTVILCTLQVHAGEEYNFSWKLGKEDVGDLTVKTEFSEVGTSIIYSSSYTVDMSVELKNRDEWHVVYSPDNIMTSFEIRNDLNGRTRIDIMEGASDGGTSRVVNGKAKLIDRDEVHFSYVLLFVKEPVGITELYSELYGENFQVRETGKHNYTVTDSRNRRHKFFYNESGDLVKAEIIKSVGTFTLIPR